MTFNMCAKFETSSFTSYKDTKGDQKFTKRDALCIVVLKVVGNVIAWHSISHINYVSLARIISIDGELY